MIYEHPDSHFSKYDQNFIFKHLLSEYMNKDIPVVMAEVGNLTGNSTRFFYDHIHPESTFYSVDQTLHDIDVANDIIRIKSNSLKWTPPEELDFIYLDGNHDPNYVYKEIKHFSNYTDIITGHDGLLIKGALEMLINEKEKRFTLLMDNFCSSWILRYV